MARAARRQAVSQSRKIDGKSRAYGAVTVPAASA
jgi:hypothetical protein